MRFHLGDIPISPDFVPDASWKPLKQPSPWMQLLAAYPIGFVAAGIVAGLWLAVTPFQLQDVTSTMSLPAFLVAFVGMVIVHELIHLLVHPRSGRSLHSIVGAGGPTTGIYAHYAGEMTRNRFVAILLMPLAIISFVPLFLAAIAQASSGWMAFISAFNAFGACADTLDAGLVLVQIPATATVRCRGLRIYWKEHDTFDGQPVVRRNAS